MRGCREAYYRLADSIWEACERCNTVLDVGCGLRYVLDHLEEISMWCDGYGIDLHSPIADRRVDIRQPWTHGKTFDLVICTETAEHVEEKYADQIVETVCAHARNAIVWSAAPPGQEGTDHVNLKPAAWWLEKFEALGWVPNTNATEILRRSMHENTAQHRHCSDNFYVLEPA